MLLAVTFQKVGGLIYSTIHSDALELAACQVGASASLGGGLARGILRRRFQGELLHGYFRLRCLPTGKGQLWQLTPIGQV